MGTSSPARPIDMCNVRVLFSYFGGKLIQCYRSQMRQTLNGTRPSKLLWWEAHPVLSNAADPQQHKTF
ncbi:uncharacterized protein FOMMEDRAFT_160288 [Fomitiporia mediterranea MF3/22]|uniref:uncharacterized protein n=1 Tax=Fomitiporia mediterranea (strain MF3/22) TaxID=694068 RepID=UPI000440985C|nr:uncharacterized protein FOMMEDRAFT_160288 [Fomitiporia mediterranea MF3/22]EJC99842.1 hypothetical protein FOMMEDRAFT_160288 [Fomitiporia mediterranea MF3/22]